MEYEYFNNVLKKFFYTFWEYICMKYFTVGV